MIRNYFWGDQLSYLSISAANSAGLFRDLEPFTESGRSIYPSGFYAAVGIVAKLGHLKPAMALNLSFVLVSLTLILLVTLILRGLFKSELVVFAVLTPVLLGTLNSTLTGTWSKALSSHAVIWPMAAGL